MPAPLDPRHLDDAIKRYLAGEAQEEILAATGISATTLHRVRVRRGIPPRRNIPLDAATFAEAYMGGESEYAIAKRFGVSRTVIRDRLKDAGVTIRGSSAAGLMRVSRTPADQLRRQVEAAHRAPRRRITEEELFTRARAREHVGRLGSPGEQLLAHLLEERGFAPIPQKAIGKYNVDMSFDSIAVEVLGGNWHAANRTHATRSPYILNEGWHLIFVWNFQPHSPITAGAADYIATFYEEARWQPSLPSQYRVISGHGKLLTARSADSDEFSLVPPPRGANNLRP